MLNKWSPEKAKLTPAKWLEAIDFVVFKPLFHTSGLVNITSNLSKY